MTIHSINMTDSTIKKICVLAESRRNELIERIGTIKYINEHLDEPDADLEKRLDSMIHELSDADAIYHEFKYLIANERG